MKQIIKHFLKKFSISRFLFSSVFSIALFYMTKIHFGGFVGDNNYFEKIFLTDFAILLLYIPLIYLLLSFLEKHTLLLSNFIISNNQTVNKKKFCIVAFIFLFLLYLVYYLSFYPGGVYVDTWTSLRMIQGKDEFTDQQPVLYSLSLKLVDMFSPNVDIGFAIHTGIQVLAMVSIFTYFIYWMLNKNVNSKLVTLITLLLGLFKLFPLYSVSVWKDTPFSLAIFVLTLTCIDIIIEFKDGKVRIANIVKTAICSILILFLRSNGLFICAGMFAITAIVLLISKIKKAKIKNLLVLTITLFISLIIFVVAKSLFPLFGITSSSTTALIESLAIPMQQVARVISVNGNITPEQEELIDKVLPRYIINERYTPLLVDPIKWDKDINADYLKDNLGVYGKLWFELFLQNPKEYVYAYLLQTSGFWTLNVRGTEAYHSAIKWETLQETEQIDLLGKNYNITLRPNLLSVPLYSGGLFFWITAFSMFITYRISNKKYLIAYIPSLILWATVMISTPMGSALRYVFILVLMLPINLIYPAFTAKYEEYKNQKLLESKNND